MVTTAIARPRGRPPDPDIESRVYRATLELYAQVGWAGLTLDAVASRCRVGKFSIYRRWASKEALIVEAIRSMGPESSPFEPIGEIRADLISFVETLIAALTGPLGLVHLRAQLEAKVYPDPLGKAMETIRLQWISTARKIVRQAIERGEVPAGTSPALVFDALRGVVLNHFLLMPLDRTSALVKNRREFAENLVAFVLRGIGAGT